jgi:hypothetical protein
MSERTRNEKSIAQDALGFLCVLVGGFFAVSIVLFLAGQEPAQGAVSRLTGAVLVLVSLLGAWAALLFSAAMAALGTVLFLRPAPLDARRPFLALSACALGAAFLFGAFGGGGALGAWLPALLTGFPGRAATLVLGTALAWFGAALLAPLAARRGYGASELAQARLLARQDAAAGVSSAEAALLGNEQRPPVERVGAGPRREEPLREASLRPFPPRREAKPSGSGRPAAEPLASMASARTMQPETLPTRQPSAQPSAASAPLVEFPAPPAPSWEQTTDDEAREEVREARDEALEAPRQEASAPEEHVAAPSEEEEPLAALIERFDAEAVSEALEEQELEAESSAPATTVPSWEQASLFDEEEDAEASTGGGSIDLTRPFDFEAMEPARPTHEPQPDVAEAPVRVANLAEPGPLPAAPRAQDGAKDYGLEPARAAPVQATEEARDEEGERWSRLVYEAGCAILEQKRVAVSMLERRFGIDFDQACRVLDELQQAGLIGPYMGGRTRDILLTREEWLPHAP